MFCTTECWNCEDKNCEHYISKQELFFDNQLLKTVLDEIREYINELDNDTENIIYDIDRNVRDDLLQILDKVGKE